MDKIKIGFRHISFDAGFDEAPHGVLEYICKTADTEGAMKAIGALITSDVEAYQDADGNTVIEILPKVNDEPSEAVLERLAQIGNSEA